MCVSETERTSSPHVNITAYIQPRGGSWRANAFECVNFGGKCLALWRQTPLVGQMPILWSFFSSVRGKYLPDQRICSQVHSRTAPGKAWNGSWFIEKRVFPHREEEARGEEKARGLRLSRTCEFGCRHITFTSRFNSPACRVSCVDSIIQFNLTFCGEDWGWLYCS